MRQYKHISRENRPLGALSLLAVIIAVLLSGCSHDSKETLSALLETVPADAGGVVVVNMESILKEAGCKVKADGVELSEPVRKLVGEAKTPSDSIAFGLLVEGKGGVDLSSIIGFSSSRFYLTGLLDDTSKFRSFVESVSGSSFEGDDKAGVCGEYAIVDNQFWICLSGRPELSDLERYHRLSENQSIKGRKGIEKLIESDGKIVGLADLQSMFRTGGIQRSPIPMALATIFDTPTQFFFEGNMKKDQLIFKANFLGNNGKVSKFLLPTSKLDVDKIKKMTHGCDALIAVSITEEMLKKVASMLGNFGASILRQDSPLLQIDGTCVFADGAEGGLAGLISTKGTPSPALVSLGSEYTGLQTTVEDNMLWLNKEGRLKGSIDGSAVADRFKGSMAGAIVDLNSGMKKAGMESKGDEPRFIEIMLRPESGSLTIEVTTTFDGRGLEGVLDSIL